MFRGANEPTTETDLRAAFHEHKDAVYRFAWRMMNSPAAAEDIAQDVFLSLLRQPDRFDGAKGPLRPFLLGVARNLILKKWRDDGRWNVLDEGQCFLEPAGAAQAETAAMVAGAVRLLPPLQREALLLEAAHSKNWRAPWMRRSAPKVLALEPAVG